MPTLRAGSVTVVHLDEGRGDWFTWTPPEPLEWDARGPVSSTALRGRTLGRLLRVTRRNRDVLAALAQREAECQRDDAE